MKKRHFGKLLLDRCLSESGSGSQCPYILGDFTPRYLVDGYHWQDKWYHQGKETPEVVVPHKIKLILPDTKIIMLFRNPTDRLFSSYKYFKIRDSRGKTKSPEDFHERAKSQIATWYRCLEHTNNTKQCMYGFPATINPPIPPHWTMGSHDQLRYGMYSLFLIEWLQLFDKDQFLIIKFEDYSKDPAAVLQQRTLPFLGLEPFSEVSLDEVLDQDVVNSRTMKGNNDMLPETRHMLDHFYSPFNHRLAELLNDDRFLWGQK